MWLMDLEYCLAFGLLHCRLSTRAIVGPISLLLLSFLLIMCPGTLSSIHVTLTLSLHARICSLFAWIVTTCGEKVDQKSISGASQDDDPRLTAFHCFLDRNAPSYRTMMNRIQKVDYWELVLFSLSWLVQLCGNERAPMSNLQYRPSGFYWVEGISPSFSCPYLWLLILLLWHLKAAHCCNLCGIGRKNRFFRRHNDWWLYHTNRLNAIGFWILVLLLSPLFLFPLQMWIYCHFVVCRKLWKHNFPIRIVAQIFTHNA